MYEYAFNEFFHCLFKYIIEQWFFVRSNSSKKWLG